MDNNIKLILLDFDGTLADTYMANYMAYAEILKNIDYNLTEEEYKAKYFGVSCLKFMHQVGVEDATERESMRQQKIAVYPQYFNHIVLNSSLWEFCKSFRNTGGRVWVVSSGSRNNIENAMLHLGIRDGVDGILTYEDIERTKPYPDCFLKAMSIEGVSPKETLIFEDSKTGIEAAQRSGANYIVVKL